jgi:hypothetical protein
MVSRPSETLQAAVASFIGAALVIYGVAKNGFDFEDLANPEVSGAITILIGFVSAGVTWYVGRKQRAGTLTSAPDGTVQ